MKIIDLAYRQGLLNYENARRQLEIRITKTFYNLLASRENISHLEESLDLAEKQLEKNRVARANGLASELTWQQSRLSTETARYNLNYARGNYLAALEEFLAELGMDFTADIIPEGEISVALPKLESEVLIREYLPLRPDIRSQKQTIERLELSQKQSALSSRSPNVDISTSWRAGPQNNTGYSGNLTDSLSGSLTLRVPIDPWIPGTRSNQTLRAASAEVEKARLDLESTEAQARSQIRSLVVNLENSWQGLEIALLQEELALRTYELSEDGFRNGAVEFLAYEKTRGDLNDARFRRLQAELNYQNLILDLAAALNTDWKLLMRSSL
jgi:outer membrane protein TolC